MPNPAAAEEAAKLPVELSSGDFQSPSLTFIYAASVCQEAVIHLPGRDGCRICWYIGWVAAWAKSSAVTSVASHLSPERLLGQLKWQCSVNLRDESSFLNAHNLQRKLLGWKGRTFQNVTVITICSRWKASLLMGGYPAWFLCVAHPLPVPVSNRKGLKQRREEHWLPGNGNTEWRNSRWVQTDLTFWPELQWVTDHSAGLNPLSARAAGVGRRRVQQVSSGGGHLPCQMVWTGMKEAKKQSLGEVKERDVELNICFVTVDSVFSPFCSILWRPCKGSYFAKMLQVSFWILLDRLFMHRWKSGHVTGPLLSQTGVLSDCHCIFKNPK